ncbi:MAG: type I methionyl aminopeptidase [Ruminiclostridium sp.]|nr:type I methionyl aminopeptidase [Ruminiclostridium sp.]MBQ8410316.1 type I methionyl aminopeptidase [Ruminiclostridium sp.]MBQ8842458.1 type I methionyl aminopeptidase [Ruminiclostridium sp.]
MIQVKSADEITRMMKAGEIAAQALAYAGRSIKPGMSTWELDKLIHDFIVSKGARPSSLGYCGFTGSACISINEELIHGIPSKKKIIKDGDIVSVDLTVEYDGWNGDNARTFMVGEVSDEAKRLLKVTEEALYEGIKMAVAGNRIGDISNAVQTYCEKNGYHVVRKYIGHGIGRDMHEDPEVPNFGKPGRGPRLVPGMTICIEPMINSSTSEVIVLPDKWTVVEANGNLSAHFEHTVCITNGEPIIMTLEKH